MELSSLDLYYVVQELQALQGAKVEKIFQSSANKRDLLFILYAPGQPKLHLRFMLPGIIAKVEMKPAYPQVPPGFAMFLRKYIAATRLTAIEQLGFNRIMKLTFSSKEVSYTLLAELIPPGNMLLLDNEERIINLLENQQFKERTLRGRQHYAAPASFNIIAATDDELIDRIAVSTSNSIVTTLAINFGLGGIYAEEVCIRAGIAKHRNDLSHHEIRQIVSVVRDIFKQPLAAHTSSSRAYPFALQSRSTQACEQTSFLAAIAQFIEDVHTQENKGKQEQKVKENKLQAIIDAQEKQIAKFEQDAIGEQRKAERIYEEYQLLSEILAAAREARERKQNISDALKKFPQVKGYKDATGEIEIELGEQ